MTDRAFLQVTDEALQDLHDRLRRTRWPDRWPIGDGWDAGVPQDALRRLVERWSTDYDWRAAEAAMNSLPWNTASIAGLPVGYLRFDGHGPDPVPIVLTNGWPSSALELVPIAQRLVRDIDGISFTVIVPALPGFAGTSQQSALPPQVPTHELWHRLMHDVLGFPTYLAHGGDLGAGTSSLLAQAHPDAVIGLHLLAVADPPQVDPATITPDEQAYLDEVARWYGEDGAYEHQQRTRPLTLGYALSDSPVGLLAWILEKYHDWTDRLGDETSRLDDDLILTQASLYWFTNTISTSFRPYYEHAQGHTARVLRVDTPTAIALFPKDLSHPPRSWAERTYAVTRYTALPHGGHFAATEVPDLLADDIRAFARSLSRISPSGSAPAPASTPT